MAMKNCRECGKEVSSSAKTCPHCGTPHPTTSMSPGARSCLAVIGAFFLLIVVVGMCSEGFDATAPSNEAARSPVAGGSAGAGTSYYAPQAVNIRSGPGTNHGVVRTLQSREVVQLGRTDATGWAPVLAGGDTAGYVKADILRRGTPPALPNLEVLNFSHESAQYGGGYVVGRVRNNTGRTYSYVQVQINLLDRNGNVVGSTLDNMNNLGPGEIWRFRAVVLEDNAARFRIEDVTGY